MIAVVALEEDADVRLTTNIVGCDPDDVHIGQEVAVRFEQHDDVWIPLFEPTGAPDGPNPFRSRKRPLPRPGTDRRPVRAPVGARRASAAPRSGRRLMVDPLSLTVDACLAAVADAGLTLDDIDGLSTYPGMTSMGMSEGGVTAVEEALRLHPTWINGGGDLPGPRRRGHRCRCSRSSAGLCRHVLVLPHRVGVDVRALGLRPTWRRPGVGLSWSGGRRSARCRPPTGSA